MPNTRDNKPPKADHRKPLDLAKLAQEANDTLLEQLEQARQMHNPHQ